MYSTGGYLTFNLEGVKLQQGEANKVFIEGFFEAAEASVRLSKPIFLQHLGADSNVYGILQGGFLTTFLYDKDTNLYYCTIRGNYNNQYHINVSEDGAYVTEYNVE